MEDEGDTNDSEMSHWHAAYNKKGARRGARRVFNAKNGEEKLLSA